MNLRRVSVLLGKELFQGPKSFMFVMTIVAPVVISLVISLAFGTLFDHRPTLGIVDEGNSRLVSMLDELPSVVGKAYATETELKDAVAKGAIDSGLVLAEDFDSSVLAGERVEIPIYVWGESLAQDRLVITAAVANQVRELAGQEAPVEIKSITLGDEESIPWSDRMLPFVVLMAVVIAGLGLSGTSLLSEKERRTVDALVITPATIGEVFVAKGLLGIILGTFMGVVILVLNQALGSQPGLLVMLLFLGSIMAAEIGLLAGSLADDITAFFASMKIMGILLYAPVVIYMFPGIPQWIGHIFPTYYIVEPIIQISQRGGGWPEIAMNTFILLGLNILLVVLIAVAVSRKRQYAV